ncbi:hypothetical protein EYC84_009538 [Monilinia fructicola]|uniref:Uncharacterized protein n=1 Tax=Monilinia fructicola TaxID=38448 RepID=A0A5M9JCS0_MONFR|nr:hypothetical protein EYC84_009538 [Monilinia fructicola]
MGGDAIVCLGGAAFCTEGVEKSNRSPNEELAFAPNPLEELNVRDTCEGAVVERKPGPRRVLIGGWRDSLSWRRLKVLELVEM